MVLGAHGVLTECWRFEKMVLISRGEVLCLQKKVILYKESTFWERFSKKYLCWAARTHYPVIKPKSAEQAIKFIGHGESGARSSS